MATFSNHFYKWKNAVRRQRKGGAIGLRATGSLARITMDFWIECFKEKLSKAGIEVWHLKKYVDDVLVLATNLELGSRWQGGEVVCSEIDKCEDLALGRSPEEITMNVLNQAADEILDFLEFTSEVSKGAENPIP